MRARMSPDGRTLSAKTMTSILSKSVHWVDEDGGILDITNGIEADLEKLRKVFGVNIEIVSPTVWGRIWSTLRV